MAKSQAQSGGERSVALTQELSGFLIELSIALHRHAMYPQGHPSLAPAAAGVVARLANLLARRSSLSLGVARRQLVIEGVATDPAHPVLQELAGRLHRHHIGAIRFETGTDTAELADVLRMLAVEADRTGEPLGLGAPEQLRAWPHITLYPLTYGQLELVDDADEEEQRDAAAGGTGARAARLWVGLARAALQAPAEAEVESAEPAAVAHAINRHERASAYDQVIVGYMLQIAEELKADGGRDALALRRRISSLIGELDDATLERLVEMSGDLAQRGRFVSDASRVFAADAVVEVVRAAANASQQSISHSMLRMLSKLASHADRGDENLRERADSELREQVRQLVSGWSLADPNPSGYTLALQSMAGNAPRADHESLPAADADPERIIVMALEVDAYGEPVARALDELVASGRIARALSLLEDASEGEAASALWERLASTETLETEITRTGADLGALTPLVKRLGTTAIPVLLRIMETSESRGVRRAMLDMLRDFGQDAGRAAARRLTEDELPWYVQRNLLGLLAETAHWPAGLDASLYLSHLDARVRREAYRVLFQVPTERDRALCTGIGDPDPRNLLQALAAAREKLPSAAVPLLTRRLQDAQLTEDLRVQIVRALEGSNLPLARDALLRVVKAGRRLFGGIRLAGKSAVLIAALRVLATRWRQDRVVAPALAAAARSRDADVRNAVEPTAP